MKNGLQVLTIALLIVGASRTPRAQQKTHQWTSPRTAWGDPDLQGTWTNETITPFERPASLADKPFLTKAEASALEARAAQQREHADDVRRPGDVGSYNQEWFDSGSKVVSTLQASLVVEPADGRVPLRPEAIQLRADYDKQNGDAPEFMSPWDRCITRGIPGGFFPAGYNNGYQIIQTPGYVVIHYEMIHAARIIPTDGRAHRPSHLRSWDGESVGHWDGDTLVVDVTNYNGKGWIATNAAAGRMRGILQSDALHAVERFTRVRADTIHYDVTIDDPKMYTRPWKVAIPLERDEQYRLYEYACHEGNRAVENVLRLTRALEAGQDAGKREPTAAPPQDAGNRGQVAFDRVCKSCHGPEALGDAGPRLVPFSRDDEELLGIVREGSGQMPPISARELPDADVAQIVAYLKSRSQ